MGKSKYPEKYDTSVEIPVIRGNINELSVDYINSLRSAILQIQHTLGLMPQGNATSNVADRLSKSLDSSGNIKKESLDSAGVIYGPITNENIAKLAGIDESKLKLDFPTKVLQTEYSLINSKLTEVIEDLEEVISKLGSHVYTDAVNRHSGKSIKISEILTNPSDLAVASLAVTNAQDAIEAIFSGHINYSGLNISSVNNSHVSNQIYFDNTNVSEDVSGSDLQTVIEEIIPIARNSQITHQNLYHSNGYMRSGIITDSKTATELASSLSVSFFKSTISDTARKAKIILTTPQEIFDIKEYNYISVNLTSGDAVYNISDIELDSGNLVQAIYVYGSLPENSTGSSVISIFKNSNRETSAWGLATAVVESPSLLSANMIKIADPNAPGVVSEGFKTNSVTSLKRYLQIEVNGKTYTADAYNASYTIQTIDSTISAINESLINVGAPAFAYKLYSIRTNQHEVAIVSNFKETDSYIKISRIDDAIDLLGFSRFEDKSIYPTYGSTHLIKGIPYSGLNVLMSLEGLILESGGSISGANFLQYNLKINDIVNIIGTDSDDGSYLITNITSTRLYVNTAQLAGSDWSGASQVTSKFIVYNDTQSFDSYDFIKTAGSPAGLLFELILNEDNNLHFRTIAEYQAKSLGGNSLYAVIDCEQEPSAITKDVIFEIVDTDLYCYIESSNKIKITNYKNYPITLLNNEYNSYIKLFIYSATDIASYMVSLAVTTLSASVTVYEKKSYENVLAISKAPFYATVGRIEGGPDRTPSVLVDIDYGSISVDQISNKVKKELQEVVYKDTRSNGISRGLELTSVELDLANGDYVITVSSGVAYVNGKRFQLDSLSSWSTNLQYTTYDKIIIAINSEGIVIADSADSATCNFYINQDEYAIIATVEYNGADLSIIDQRLLINDLDFKLINSVTVSPQSGLGHFTSINKAIKYAKRFSQIFPNAGTPEILLKAGTHRIVVDTGVDYSLATNQTFINSSYESGILLDFPIKIVGEGDSTVLDIITTYNDYPESGDDRTTTSVNKGYFVIIGSGASSYHSPFSTDKLFESSIVLRDFKIKNSTILYLDPEVSLAGSTKQNTQFLKVENIYFDWSNLEYLGPTFENSYYFNKANAFFVETDDVTSGYIGNFAIDGCTFDNCFIDISKSGFSYRNITISNNSFFSRRQITDIAYKSFLVKTAIGESTLTAGSFVFNNNPKILSLFSLISLSADGADYFSAYDALLSNGNISIGYNTVTIAGTLSVTDSMQVNGSAVTFTNPVTFDDTATFASAITIDGIATFNNTSEFNNDVSISGDLSVDGAIESTGAGIFVGMNVGGALSTINSLLLEVNGLTSFTQNVFVNADFDVSGTVSAAVKAFKIPHPDPSKENMYLVHSTVETNTAGDNMYRWSLDMLEGDNYIKLEDYHPYLNANEMIWVSPVKSFGSGFGEVIKEENKLKITVNKSGKYNVLLICTRIDPATKLWQGVEVPRKE